MICLLRVALRDSLHSFSTSQLQATSLVFLEEQGLTFHHESILVGGSSSAM